MRACGDCRAVLPDNATFCAHCGGLAETVLSAPGSAPPTPPPEPPVSTRRDPSPRPRGGYRPDRHVGRWVAVAVLVAVFGGLAWSVKQLGERSQAAQRAASVANPCSVVTQGEATALFGFPARSGVLPTPANGCIWSGSSRPGAHVFGEGAVEYGLTVGVYDLSMWASFRPRVDPFDIIPRDQTRSRAPLKGLGDKAMVATLDGSSVEVEFVKHGLAVTLAYSISAAGAPTHPKAPDQRRRVIAMARVAAGRV